MFSNYVGCSDIFHRYSYKSMGKNTQNTTTPTENQGIITLSLQQHHGCSFYVLYWNQLHGAFFFLFLLYIAQTCKIPQMFYLLFIHVIRTFLLWGSHKPPAGFIYGHISSVETTTRGKTSTNSSKGVCVVDFNNDSDVELC